MVIIDDVDRTSWVARRAKLDDDGVAISLKMGRVDCLLPLVANVGPNLTGAGFQGAELEETEGLRVLEVLAARAA